MKHQNLPAGMVMLEIKAGQVWRGVGGRRVIRHISADGGLQYLKLDAPAGVAAFVWSSVDAFKRWMRRGCHLVKEPFGAAKFKAGDRVQLTTLGRQRMKFKHGATTGRVVRYVNEFGYRLGVIVRVDGYKRSRDFPIDFWERRPTERRSARTRGAR